MNDRRLQLALDMPDLDRARSIAREAATAVDIIEAGTLLCLSQGMQAVRMLREDHPAKTILADVRIVRAGAKIADMAFTAGANWVTAVAEAPMVTIEAALSAAFRHRGYLQIELSEDWNWATGAFRAKTWRSLGIEHVIVHCTSEVEAIGTGWSQQTLDNLRSLADLGFTVTAAGGINAETLPSLMSTPADIFVVGRSIWAAPDPATAASGIKAILA